MPQAGLGQKAYFEFVGGQNSAAAPDNLADSELLKCINMDIVVRGAVRTRDGTTATTWDCFVPLDGQPAITGVIDRLVEFKPKSAALLQLALVNGNLYRRDNKTPILTGCGTHLDYTVYSDKLYLMIKNSFYVYDGTTISEVVQTAGITDGNLATIKKCKYVEARAERIYCTGNPEAPNTLYYSQIGDPTYYKTGTFMMQVASSDGDVITGLREFNEALLVFKSRGVWAWFGYSITDDVRLVRLNVHTGTKAFRTVQHVNNFLFYLGNDGVYAMKGTYSGSIDTVKITNSIDDAFTNLYVPDDSTTNTAVAVYTGGKYLLSFPTVINGVNPTTNTTSVVCFVEAGASSNILPWAIYTGVNFSSVLDSIAGTVYYAATTKPELWKFDVNAYNDRGVDFDFTFKSKDYDVGSPVHVKKFRDCWIALNQDIDENAKFGIKVYIDYTTIEVTPVDGADSGVYGKGVFGAVKYGWINTVTRWFKLSQKGLRACVEIQGNTGAAIKNRVFLYGVAFGYKIKKPYKDKG